MNLFFKSRALLLTVLAAQLLCARFAAAQDQFSEYDIKAAFLYNFGKFVEWPANAYASTNAPMLIGIYGDNPFGDNLVRLVRNRSINDHPIIARVVSADELKDCRILFISQSEQNNLGDILKKLDGSNVLTVTENLDPFKSGAMINFITVDNRIRFEINNAAAEKAGLKISSKLLVLATRTQ